MKIISDISGRRILVSPLDWGLGHAARMIPVIRDLEERNHVTILCGPGAYVFLKEELPGRDIRLAEDLKIKYPKSRIGLGTIPRWVPVMLRNTIHEHIAARRIIREMGIDLVISDNRYGLKFRGLDCYIVTHQIYPLLPESLGWLQRTSNWIFRRALSLYNKVLIPDLEDGFTLTGRLSDTEGLDSGKFVRVGILSRFAPRRIICAVQPQQKKYDVLVLISGQEMQRTVFEREMIKYLTVRNINHALMIRGVPQDTAPIADTENIEFRNMLSGNMLREAIEESELVICRAGYSTIMDMLAMGKRAVIIPTPGQTEQEYLAKRLYGKYGFDSFSE